MNKRISAMVALVGFTGCTTWGSQQVYGPKREIGRQLLGSPAIAESRSSSLSAGFAGAGGGGIAVAGLSAGADSLKLTHCVQQAQITYDQPVDTIPVVEGRGKDIGGSLALGIGGLIIVGIAKARSSTIFEPGDPLYEEPPSPVPGYVIGGGMMAAGVGLLAYSFGSLPKQPKPEIQHGRREWVEQSMVESSGCPGMPANVAQQPPGPQPIAQPTNDVAVRLQKLDALKASGAISDGEYQRKRKEIIDGI
jgi:hypothetical protein